MKQKCILGKSHNAGARVFEFEYLDGTQENEELKFVKIFPFGKENPIVRFCESNIIMIDEDAEIQWHNSFIGYLTSWEFNKIYNEWEKK